MCVCVSVVSCRPTVKLLSSEDGKQRIVQAAQQLCRSVENKALTSKDISVSLLDVSLRGSHACCCGAAFCRCLAGPGSGSGGCVLADCEPGVETLTCLCSSRFQKNPRPRAGFEVWSGGQHAGLPALAHQTHRVHVSGCSHASPSLVLMHAVRAFCMNTHAQS